MKKRIVPVLLATALTAFSITGCGSGSVKANSSAESSAESNVTYVEEMNVSKTTIENKYHYSGTVEPVNEMTVAGTISGKVASVNFDVGDYVKAGDVLYQMDTSDILNSKKVAEASLASAEANIKSAQTGVELANGASMQTSIQNAKAALDSAEIAYNQAKTNYDNNTVLYQNGIISKTEMDNFTNAYKSTKISYDQAKESYDLVNKMPAENLKKAQDSLNSAKAAKESVSAQINSYNKSLNDCTVKSPISGYVTACNVKAGGILSAALAPFVISDTSKVVMRVSVSEYIINDINTGETIDVSIPAVSDKPISGTISEINPSANTGGTYDVKVEIENTDGAIKSGMFGETTFVKDKKADVIAVPVNTVITKDNETFVFIDKNGTAVKTKVTTGIDNGTNIEITSGIESGTNVVIKGQTYLDDGDKIAVAKDDANE
ncbi:MAG: efflux RND transporter periplasmic adaptor subunit [Clostridia bacterium]|jgi:multidrug efflux pump subunit AcrA (membrane-fusion protein)|nr:efflux RND transporter periplasmic adaptor subunit [Clostridia bacterium]MCI1998970.1 efflux RND transporter periplasmic adaptor subunit [Clostridia bacterium]MCI2013720.1 efflux RND transporter periplasmic adaptor subunit [Clostridia bacterium]